MLGLLDQVGLDVFASDSAENAVLVIQSFLQQRVYFEPHWPVRARIPEIAATPAVEVLRMGAPN